MKSIDQLANWALEGDGVRDAHVIAIVPEVRTGSMYPLPPWFSLSTQLSSVGVPKK